jgi:hypothetical protein
MAVAPLYAGERFFGGDNDEAVTRALLGMDPLPTESGELSVIDDAAARRLILRCASTLQW